MRFISQEWETNQKEKKIQYASFKKEHFNFFFEPEQVLCL